MKNFRARWLTSVPFFRCRSMFEARAVWNSLCVVVLLIALSVWVFSLTPKSNTGTTSCQSPLLEWRTSCRQIATMNRNIPATTACWTNSDIGLSGVGALS